MATRARWMNAGDRRWICLDHVTHAQQYEAGADCRVRVEIHLSDGTHLTLVGRDALRFLEWLAGSDTPALVASRDVSSGEDDRTHAAHARHWHWRDPS